MDVYVQTKKLATPRECYCFDFCFGTACGAIILQWPLAQLFPAAWEGVLSQCSVYLSLMSMGKSLLLVCSQISNKICRYPWSVYV